MLKREPGLLTATNAILIAQPISLLTLLLLKFPYKKKVFDLLTYINQQFPVSEPVSCSTSHRVNVVKNFQPRRHGSISECTPHVKAINIAQVMNISSCCRIQCRKPICHVHQLHAHSACCFWNQRTVHKPRTTDTSCYQLKEKNKFNGLAGRIICYLYLIPAFLNLFVSL